MRSTLRLSLIYSIGNLRSSFLPQQWKKKEECLFNCPERGNIMEISFLTWCINLPISFMTLHLWNKIFIKASIDWEYGLDISRVHSTVISTSQYQNKVNTICVDWLLFWKGRNDEFSVSTYWLPFPESFQNPPCFGVINCNKILVAEQYAFCSFNLLSKEKVLPPRPKVLDAGAVGNVIAHCHGDSRCLLQLCILRALLEIAVLPFHVQHKLALRIKGIKCLHHSGSYNYSKRQEKHITHGIKFCWTMATQPAQKPLHFDRREKLFCQQEIQH